MTTLNKDQAAQVHGAIDLLEEMRHRLAITLDGLYSMLPEQPKNQKQATFPTMEEMLRGKK